MDEDTNEAVVLPKYQVTARDKEVLRDVSLFRYATTAQLDRLHFHHLKLAQRRLRKLAAMGLVRRFRSARLPGLADQRWFYALAPAGRRLLRGSDGALPSRVPSDIVYLAHHELLTDFHIWLREACTGSTFSFRFVPAFDRRRAAFKTALGTYLPDAVVSLDRHDGRSALFLLEVDRATEPLTRARGSSVAAKLDHFGECLDHGFSSLEERFERSYRGARQLWLVPDNRRRTAILDLAATRDLGTAVWGATHDMLSCAGALAAPAWSAASSDRQHRLNE